MTEPLFDVAGFEVFGGVLFTGVVTGLTYALLGAGLVLVYRATRVINVAQGELGAFGALLFALLAVDAGVPVLVAIPMAVLAGAAIGAAVETLVVRRLARAPRVVVLVATLGVAQVLLLCALALPDVTGGNLYPTVADWRTTVAGVDVRAQDLTVIVVVPVVVYALGLWLDRTRVGTAVRASADDADGARLAGIPVAGVSTVVWAVAGGLAVLAAVLNAPVAGQSVALTVVGFGPSLLLRGLAAGLVGGFTSLPATLAGGIGIGLLDALVVSNYPTSSGMADLVLLVLVLVVLLVRVARGGSAETAGAEGGTFTLAPRVPAMPAWTGGVFWLRHLRVGVVAAAVVVGAGLPLVVTTSASLFRLSSVLCLALVGLSVTVLLGWSGQLSLGQFAFAGVGAVTTAVLTTSHGWPFVPAVLVACAVGGALAAVVGTAALRIRGLLLAVATLAFAVATRTWLFSQPWAQTETGASVVELGSFPGTGARAYYLLCLLVFVVAGAAVFGLRRTNLGRAFVAVRDNPRAAAAAAVAVARVQLAAFAVAGALSALGGALYGGLLVRFTDAAFTPEQSLTVVAMTVVGGLGTVFGAIAGPAWVVGVPMLFGDTQAARLAASGIGLLVLLMYLPGGFAGVVTSVRDQLVGWAAVRREGGVAVPAPAVARPRRSEPPVAPPEFDGPALLVDGVTVRFGGRTALDDVRLEVAPGEILGLIGTNGAGKSTLLDVVSGFVRPVAGRVVLAGDDVTRWAPHRRAASGLGRTFQDARLFGDLTVRENLLVASAGRTVDGRTADEVCELVGLGRYADTFVADLSTGTRRLCELATMLALGPSLLLFDEPTAGVAQRDAEAFGPLIRTVRAELGAAAVVVEHDVPLLVGMCDRLACLSAGQVLRVGRPGEVIADPAVIEAYLGTDPRAISRSGEAVR